MHADTASQLKTIATFLGIENLSDEVVEYAIQSCAFEKMKKAEEANSPLPGLNRSKNLSPEAFKVREGIVGGYKKHLSEETIQYIDQCVREKLPPLYGYS